MTRPRGRPPRPRGGPPPRSARSSAIDPVGMMAVCTTGRSPSRITEPLPNCLSICANARSSALSRSGPATMSATPVFDFAGVFADELLFTTRDTVGGGYDKNQPHCRGLWITTPLWTIAEHVYDVWTTRQNRRTKAGQCNVAGTRSGYVATTA